jgi:hypothetical protein
MEERRNDSEIRVIQNDLTHLTRRFEESEDRAETWRKAFCAKQDAFNVKLDALILKFESLPCPVREERSKHVTHQLRAIWLLTGGMLLTIITEWLGRK